MDDDPIANFINRAIVEECSVFEVEIAENGLEALDVLKACLLNSECPELILLDINMPIMNGHEFLEALEKVPEKPQMKVIILSSSGAQKDIDAVYKKVEAYITKPLTESKFQQILKILNS